MAVLAALATPGSVSRLTGIAHLRGHETDRLAALSAEINRLGGDCPETPDGLLITATPLRPGTWRSYADHRMATAGAIVGLRVAGVQVDDIETTAKTLPQFPRLWADMLGGVWRLRPGDYDESDVKIRSGRGSRPRTKTRPEHADAKPAMVVSVDRGRWGCVLDGDPDRRVTAMRARELGRTPIVVGDDVDVVGDLSGRPDTLARIVRRGPRRTVLRRTADDTDPTERVVVANADQLLIVVALADPPPRTGLVDRTLIAAYAGGLIPILCLTKTDLAPAAPFAEQFADLDLDGGHRRPRRPVGRRRAPAGRENHGAARSFRGRQVNVGESACPGSGSGSRRGHRHRQGAAHLDAIGGAAAGIGSASRLGDRYPGDPLVRAGPHRAQRRDAGFFRPGRGD